MEYLQIERRLDEGGVVILDGGTGTELQRRGVPMDPHAWCGPASLENVSVLEAIHRDYIAAGADVITANTYASSRLMLEAAGYGDRFAEINRAAVAAARKARDASGKPVLIAGSLSHMRPARKGSADRLPPEDELEAALTELALLLRDEGCDLILLEMMYRPERIGPAFRAAEATGLPVWAGFSARRSDEGRLLGHPEDKDIPLEQVVRAAAEFKPQAAGIMHSPANITADALAVLRQGFDGPLLAYPDSGYFTMPQWQFEDIIPVEEFRRYAAQWVESGVQIVGGCCGLSPEHIAALAPLKGVAAR